MREFFYVERKELMIFLACAAVYLLLVFGWNLIPTWTDSATGTAKSTAEDVYQAMAFMPDLRAYLGDLPAQSVSKLFVSVALYFMALVYAVIAVASGPYRAAAGRLALLALITFLAWSALNYWVIAGFISVGNPLIPVVAVILLIIWFVGTMRAVGPLHDPLATFMVRFGLGLAMFITIAQLFALLTPEWRSPTQGIPVLYTMTFNAIVGVFIAGAGGNMLWRERREQMLAAGSKKR